MKQEVKDQRWGKRKYSKPRVVKIPVDFRQLVKNTTGSGNEPEGFDP
jgi:hypothetical protein